jgi:uncharacterized protein (TIGR00251 family)
LVSELLQETEGGVILKVKVSPGAKRNQVKGVDAGALKVAVTAPPEKGKANEAVVELLADYFGLPRREVSILHGHTSRSKVVMLTGASIEDVKAKLGLLL